MPDADRLAVARATLAAMGLTVADLLAAAAPAPPTQTVAEYLPTVRAAAGPSRSKTYCPYWDRLGASTLACRPLGEVRTSDLLTWVTAVKKNALHRRNSRDGRSARGRAASATSKSAVSRRFVAMTETALSELLAAPLGNLDLVALMIDGVHFGEHLCVVALGIGIDGTKHPLGLVEGSTENTTVVTELLTDLRERGLDTTRPILVGIDGGKALHASIMAVFDHPVIQRCQMHKLRNVADKLPDDLAATVTKKMRAAYHAPSAIIAEAQLEALARELEHTHPGAAGSLREGLSETLTVLRLGVSPTLARTLRSTNCIESMISICRNHSTNVKNWQNGNMALRWCAAGLVEAGKQFRRVNGHLHLPALRTALQRHVAEQGVGADRHDETVNAA